MVIAELIRQLVKSFRKGNIGILTSATLLVIAFGTFGSYFAEKSINGQFSNLGDSIWWTLVTLSTVGFGDKVPMTVAGRVIGAICMIAGPVLMVSFLGSIGVLFYDRWTKGVRGMAHVKSIAHLIICGWNKRAEEIINELRVSNLRDLPITIIDDNTQTKPVEDGEVFFVKGNACELQVLERANITEAKFAIVLAENGMPVADQKTVLTVLAIKKSNHSIITCAELNDTNNEVHLKAAGCEIIINGGVLSARLLAMSLMNPAVNAVITDLISQEGSEVYRMSVPEKLLGHLFVDALSELKKVHNIIAIGIERNGNVIVNPAADEAILSSDMLLVLSADAPSF